MEKDSVVVINESGKKNICELCLVEVEKLNEEIISCSNKTLELLEENLLLKNENLLLKEKNESGKKNICEPCLAKVEKLNKEIKLCLNEKLKLLQENLLLKEENKKLKESLEYEKLLNDLTKIDTEEEALAKAKQEAQIAKEEAEE